jgi:hypothetical protein
MNSPAVKAASITCPRCKGTGEGATHFLNDYPGANGCCGMCTGTGEVSAAFAPQQTLDEARDELLTAHRLMDDAEFARELMLYTELVRADLLQRMAHRGQA